MFKILIYDENSDAWNVQATAYKRAEIDMVANAMPDSIVWMLVIVLKMHGAKSKETIKT
ncbi:MAG: hypothetical protein WC222_11455 [Parachlamydiales bacterium]|jgi:hypothetical protein